MRCSYCGCFGHTLANCPKTWEGSVNRFHMRCNYCGGRDHKASACPKTRGGVDNRRWRAGDVSDDYFLD